MNICFMVTFIIDSPPDFFTHNGIFTMRVIIASPTTSTPLIVSSAL